MISREDISKWSKFWKNKTNEKMTCKKILKEWYQEKIFQNEVNFERITQIRKVQCKKIFKEGYRRKEFPNEVNFDRIK